MQDLRLAIRALCATPVVTTVAILSLALGIGANTPQVAQPDLTTVLQRAGGYVNHFYEQLSGMVAEETYTQTWTRVVRMPAGDSVIAPTDHDVVQRRLRSDVALVHQPGDEWLLVRDVFEVDRVPVRDHAERLTQLFLQPAATVDDQVGRIKAESARYNLGDIVRNLNSPLFPLEVLRPSHQGRFRFKRATKRDIGTMQLSPDTEGVYRTSSQVWVIDYEEVSRPTLIQTGKNGNKDLSAHGRFWIEPTSGRALIAELRVRDQDIDGTIDVSYQSEPLLGLFVPVEMREDYRESGSHITGVASYGNFRQFQVKVDEKLKVK